MGRRYNNNNNNIHHQKKNQHRYESRAIKKEQKTRVRHERKLQELKARCNTITDKIDTNPPSTNIDHIKIEPEFIECIRHIQSIPFELQNIIWRQYWRYKYSQHVIHDLIGVLRIFYYKPVYRRCPYTGVTYDVNKDIHLSAQTLHNSHFQVHTMINHSKLLKYSKIKRCCKILDMLRSHNIYDNRLF